MKALCLATSLVLAGATPAVLCECSTMPFPDSVTSADLVIIGRIASVTELAPDGSWAMEVIVTKALRGQSPGKVVLGGGRLVGCEWGPEEFTVAGGRERAWAFALEHRSLWNGRYWLYLCKRNWARVKTPQLGGDYTEAELADLAARKGARSLSKSPSRTTRG